MYSGHTVGVVVNAYNEESFVGEVLETMPDYVDRIYAVDDGSTDDTWAEIQSAAERLNAGEPADPVVTTTGTTLADRVVPIQLASNGGVGASKKAGYRRALADGVDVVATMDGDGQMDPAALHRFLDPVVRGDVDYAKGNRLWYPESRRAMPRFRLFGNAVLTLLTKLASGYFGSVDPQNGYTAISREALAGLPLERLTDRYGFLNDQLVALNVNDVRIADVVHPARYGDEASGISLTGFVPRLSALLLTRFVRRLTRSYLVFEFHPLVLYYLFGALGMVVGLALGVGLVATAEGLGGLLSGLGLSTTVFLLGALAFVAGMVQDVAQNADRVVHVADGIDVDEAAPTRSPSDLGSTAGKESTTGPEGVVVDAEGTRDDPGGDSAIADGSGGRP